MPRKIDINSHSNQTPLKHAPVEWNFLLNKVLLTQLPAPRARAELSNSSLSTLMNPLKYRLIGIAALAQADPVTPGSSGLRGPQRLGTLSCIFPDSHSCPVTKQQLDTSWSEGEEMAERDKKWKIVLPLLQLLSYQASEDGTEKGRAQSGRKGSSSAPRPCSQGHTDKIARLPPH